MKAPALAHYRPWIDNLRKEKPYQLDDKLEELFHEKSQTGYSAWNRLFDETHGGAALRRRRRGADARADAQAAAWTRSRRSARRPPRRWRKTFKENLRLFTHITNTLAKDKEISDRWRGFKDIADARHLSNRVEPEVVAALVEAVRAAYPRLSHRYYAMKAKWLGKDKLDALGPQCAAAAGRHARRAVGRGEGNGARCLSRLRAGDGGDRRHASSTSAGSMRRSRPGKTPGAFAHPTVPSAHPYVLLNYLGKTRDVMTLAHELGHGVHQVLAAEQGALDGADAADARRDGLGVRRDADLPVASSRQTTDPKKRKALLASKVEDMLNTVVRQIAFYTFERKVHTARKEGELTADQICEIWLEVQSESLGPGDRSRPGL